MKTIVQMKQDYSALLKETEDILDLVDEGDRAMTAEETAKYDAGIVRLTEMKKDIEQRMKLEAVATPTFGEAQPTAKAKLQPNPDETEIDQPQAVIRTLDGGPRIEVPRPYGRMVAFEKTPKGHMQAHRA